MLLKKRNRFAAAAAVRSAMISGTTRGITGVRLAFSLLTLAAVMTLLSSGSVIAQLSLTDQVDRADLIFVGTAVQRDVALSRDVKFPFTFVTFTVEQTLKGASSGSQLTLRLAGGEIGGRGVLIDGMPEFQVGQRYLLFVSQNGMAGCPLLGWGQGVMQFAKDGQTGKTVLSDERGAQLLGIAGDKWLRGSPQFAPRAGAVYSTQAQGRVVSGGDLGSEVVANGTDVRNGAPVAASAVDADRVLAALRALVTARQSVATSRTTLPVRSALPAGVPASVAGMAVAPSSVVSEKQ